MQKRQKMGIAAGFLAGFATGWNLTNVGAIATDTASSYGISLAAVGLFTTALFITHLCVQVPGGRLADRFGAHRVCLLGLGIIGVGAALSMIAPVPALGIAARALTGIGTGLGFIAGSAYVRRTGGSPFAQGLYGGIGLAAGGVALAVIPQLVPAFSWRAPYVTALTVVAAAFAALALAPADHGEHAPPVAASRAGVMSDARLYPLIVLYATTFGLGVVLSNWVVELLEHHNVGDDAAGLIGGLILMLGVVSRPLGGWVVRHQGTHVRLVVGLSLVAGAAGSAVLAISNSVAAAIAGCILLGIGGGVAFSPAFTGAALLRPDAPATAVGFVNGSGAATILVCTPLVGLTFSLPGDGRIGFAAATVIWLIALALLPSQRLLGGPAPPD